MDGVRTWAWGSRSLSESADELLRMPCLQVGWLAPSSVCKRMAHGTEGCLEVAAMPVAA